jgi:hypothetical protein
MLDEVLRLAKADSAVSIYACEHVEIDLGCDQVLAQTVVQFSGNAAALIVLDAKQARRKPAQGGRALFHDGFQSIMGPAQSILGLLALVQVISSLVLPLPRRNCGAHCADESGGTKCLHAGTEEVK